METTVPSTKRRNRRRDTPPPRTGSNESEELRADDFRALAEFADSQVARSGAIEATGAQGNESGTGHQQTTPTP
jgi:hypothetical protein